VAGGVTRVRGVEHGPGFRATLDARRIFPGTWEAQRLAAVIRDLRTAQSLPGSSDREVEFAGNVSCWARPFAEQLWLLYSATAETLKLWSVHLPANVQ
jgi:hypothetical protein